MKSSRESRPNLLAAVATSSCHDSTVLFTREALGHLTSRSGVEQVKKKLLLTCTCILRCSKVLPKPSRSALQAKRSGVLPLKRGAVLPALFAATITMSVFRASPKPTYPESYFGADLAHLTDQARPRHHVRPLVFGANILERDADAYRMTCAVPYSYFAAC